MELNDEGAALLAAACKLLQGPAATALTPEQCRFVNADFMVSFWLVRSLALSCAATHLTRRRHVQMLAGVHHHIVAMLPPTAHVASRTGMATPLRAATA